MAIGDMITVFITQIVEKYDLNKDELENLENLWKTISEQKCNYLVKKNTPDEYMCNKTVKIGDKCYKHGSNKRVKNTDINKCCIHIIRKKDNTEERCTRIGKQNNLCSKHLTVKKIKDVTCVTNVKKCLHIIHKKNDIDLQCTRNAIDDGEYCKKHKKTIIVNDEDSAEEEEEVEKTMETEEEMMDKLEKEMEEDEENNDTSSVHQEVVEEITKYQSLFSDDEMENEMKCSHIIHKKKGSKMQCNKIAMKGSEYCNKHNKSKKSSTVCYI